MSASSNEWDSYWKSRQAFGVDLTADRQHRFVDEEFDAPLDAFWNEVLSDLPRETRVLDLACGSGAVLKTAHALGFRALTGIDRSSEAIDLLVQTDGIEGVASPLDEMPFDKASFDLVTSQFGFEYAGAEALAPTISDIIVPGGAFIALVHLKGGVLAESSEQLRAEAAAFEETGFVPAAQTFFTELYRLEAGQGDQAALNAAMAAQTDPQRKLVELAAHGHQLSGHVLEGASWLFENRNRHSLEYALDWFSVTREQNLAHMNRMAGMVRVALSEADIHSFNEKLRANGLTTEPPERFDPFGGRPIAWVVRASRSSL